MTQQFHDFRRYSLSADLITALLAIPMRYRPDAYANMTGDDGDGAPVICGAHGCGARIPMRQAHSAIALEYRYGVRADGYGAELQTCQHESSDHDGQHWGCSTAHLAAALHECVDAHIMPRVTAALAVPPPHEPAVPSTKPPTAY